VFLGNPGLKMSALKNYDMRLDYTPYEGGLLSYSWFHKSIKRPIEYVQGRTNSYGYTTAVNYPSGVLTGSEFEVKQDVERLWDAVKGLTVGGNLTFIKSKVMLPQSEIDGLNELSILVPMTSRDMSNAPKYLYNLYATYDWKKYAMDFGLFYTVKGDTLIAGAGQSNGHFIPSVYEKEYGTLNFSLGKKLGEHGKLSFQIKNFLNPDIQTVYRAYVLDGDKVKTTYKKGVDYTVSVNVNW
jgi:outer membrane receptor protein involved in Fe transport